VTPDELEARIAVFTQWNYRFDFDGGVATPVPDSRMINRQEQRRRYFFDALLGLYGGTLEGKRVLDLGCSAGFWALQAIEAGAEFVLGIDNQDTFIDQAELVFEAKGIDPSRYRFQRGDIFASRPQEHFDVVLCLAMMNQVSQPVELFELMSQTGAELLLVETELARSSSPVFALSTRGDGRKAEDATVVLVPSRSAVSELAGEFGYESVALARNMTDYTGLKDYATQRRLAFFCSKGPSLAALPEEEPLLLPWWLAPLDPRPRLRALRG
jgi:SAM-dependent methyltransferase